jgi:PEGA domain
MRSLINLAVLSLLLIPAAAQTSTDASKARVFITDSQSWQMTGSSGGSSDGFAGHSSGGARPQTAEIIKTFGERCSQVVVNNKQDRADYVVVLDHEGGKSILAHDNKVAVFNSDGDAVVSHSTRSLGNSVKDACEAIAKDWPARAGKATAQKQAAQLVTVSQTSATAASISSSSKGKIAVNSVPDGADVYVDDSFVGNAPASLTLPAGKHTVKVSQDGYKAWTKDVSVFGDSEVSLKAALTKN